MKFTVQELIDELSKFPRDLEIGTELSFLWNSPYSVRDKIDSMNSDAFNELSMNTANDLLIFERSWDKNNISDVDTQLKDHYCL